MKQTIKKNKKIEGKHVSIYKKTRWTVSKYI